MAGGLGAAAIAGAVILLPDLVPYAADRLSSWIDPFSDPLGDGHQTIQSLYAIGSGGATGLGLGNEQGRNTCMCLNLRTISSFPSFARSWGFSAPVW